MDGFQSTRPIRGATYPARSRQSIITHFNPRAPYGARQGDNQVLASAKHISIHAPHTGRDICAYPHGFTSNSFQSTRPIRGATVQHGTFPVRHWAISIHAPHTGRDTGPMRPWRPLSDFNPRAPYGARPAHCTTSRISDCISIHAPHTGRDPGRGKPGRYLCISIHAPHTGRDQIMMQTDGETY